MFENYEIQEIRILTTSSEMEFNLERDIREYLRYELPKKEEGKYWYRERGIDVERKNILVIFWYKNQGIGCGILHERVIEKNSPYNGYLKFYPETVFNIAPISEAEIHGFSNIPKQVVQGSPKIDISALKGILDLIHNKWLMYPGL